MLSHPTDWKLAFYADIWLPDKRHSRQSSRQSAKLEDQSRNSTRLEGRRTATAPGTGNDFPPRRPQIAANLLQHRISVYSRWEVVSSLYRCQIPSEAPNIRFLSIRGASDLVHRVYPPVNAAILWVLRALILIQNLRLPEAIMGQAEVRRLFTSRRTHEWQKHLRSSRVLWLPSRRQ